MNFLNLLGDICGVLLTIFSLLAIISKPFREYVFGVKAKRAVAESDAQAEREGIKSLLREHIIEVYYRNRSEKRLFSYEYEGVSLMYKAYKSLGGNSFVEKIWAEIQAWEVIE